MQESLLSIKIIREKGPKMQEMPTSIEIIREIPRISLSNAGCY